MPKVFVYVVDRDFGFAPNPFHGVCTLATCKPMLRKKADLGDLIMGIGGSRLKLTGRCIFALRVTRKLTFNQYWDAAEFQCKKPVRNGSRVTMVGDNIYHKIKGGLWQQSDSHHSNPDGTPNLVNLSRDTSADQVIASTEFVYFGDKAVQIPSTLLALTGRLNIRGHYRLFDLNSPPFEKLSKWVGGLISKNKLGLLGLPVDFAHSAARYTGEGSRVIK